MAVALLVGYYLLAFGLVAALALLALAAWANEAYLFFPLALLTVTVAAVVLWAMVFRRPPRPLPGSVRVTAADEPELFAMVGEVSTAMGGAMPDEVYLTPDVGASVTQRSWLGGLVVRSRRMHVGLGLVRVATAAELRAVIAHEIGHYAGGDTRLGGLLNRAYGSITRTIGAFGAMRESIPLTLVRYVFENYWKIFISLVHPTMRAQELAADAWSVRLTGRDVALEALTRVTAAAAAFEPFVLGYVTPLWERGLHPDDIHGGFAAYAAAHPDPPEQRPHPLDTHPVLSVRLAAMAEAPASDAPPDRRPARDLLADPGRWERITGDALPQLEGWRIHQRVDWDQAAADVYGPGVAALAGHVLARCGALTAGGRAASVGELLAAMTAGRQEEVAALLAAEPPPFELPAALAAVLASWLATSPSYRWATAWAGPLPATVAATDGTLLPIDGWAERLAAGPEEAAAAAAEIDAALGAAG